MNNPHPSPDQQQLLERFANRVLEVNKQFNLTGAKDFETVWNRHILDSIVLTERLPQKANVLDLGSGGGFPAIPLSIMRPDVRYTLVESTGKKARFLEETAIYLGLRNISVQSIRSEELAHDPDHREHYDAVTVRAVAALPALIELCVPFLKVDGQLLAMKGRSVESELQDSDHALDELNAIMSDLQVYEDSNGSEACIVEITKLEKTNSLYPRPAGQPAHMPL